MTWRNMSPEALELAFNPRANRAERGRTSRGVRRRIRRDPEPA